MYGVALPLVVFGLYGQLLEVAGVVLHESIEAVPFGWTETSRPAEDTPMNLQVALAYQNIDELVRGGPQLWWRP